MLDNLMFRFGAAALALGLMVTGCGDDDDDGAGGGGDTADAAPVAPQGPGGFAPDFKTSDSFFTLMGGMVPGDSPHGSVQIWYSSNLRDMIESPSFVAPEGSVSIKEFSNDNGTGYAVMVKREAGFDSDNGDWYYEMRDADGTVRDMPPPGAIETCINCHIAAAATDYLAGTGMR